MRYGGFAIATCGHTVASTTDVNQQGIITVYSLNEFPCPLCKSASNVFIPVFRKAMRKSLLAKSIKTNETHPPVGLLNIFNELKNVTLMENKDVLKHLNPIMQYSEEDMGVLQQEFKNSYQTMFTLSSKSRQVQTSA